MGHDFDTPKLRPSLQPRVTGPSSFAFPWSGPLKTPGGRRDMCEYAPTRDQDRPNERRTVPGGLAPRVQCVSLLIPPAQDPRYTKGHLTCT